MEITRILIYGFGRMGLTHFSILNKLIENKEFYIVESNDRMRFLLSKNIKAKFYKDDSQLKDLFDFTLITTPPFAHLDLLQRCLERGDKTIFVEKPFGGHLNHSFNLNTATSEVFVGYVLRFNPCISWIKKNINISEISSIHGQYLSNTLSKRPKGWRNGNYSGVLNEMGSHVLDLLTYIIEDLDLKVVQSKYESIYSDVDDILEAELESSNNLPVTLYLNWVEENIRKPIFKIKINMSNGSYYLIDQQTINIYNSLNVLIQKVSVTDILENIPYYLRGIDFTKQMESFIGKKQKMSSITEAAKVNRIMNEILSK